MFDCYNITLTDYYYINTIQHIQLIELRPKNL